MVSKEVQVTKNSNPKFFSRCQILLVKYKIDKYLTMLHGNGSKNRSGFGPQPKLDLNSRRANLNRLNLTKISITDLAPDFSQTK